MPKIIEGKVKAYSKFSGRLIGEYKNVSEAARELKLTRGNVSDCIYGRKKFVADYIFRRV